ncbi:hypothetical protein J5Y03_09080 [Bacillus sp. RG28]|uniref:Uncharacterized protein n=1 Tax=Gottfriedia endophytica TaxID=2820819 RepID=A0A940SJC9_9BACI|nr:DUF5946 family protein [Gottfriedia endophytica]MBP0725341.1 hypothetical protein [Gottfriedia endophytica]
MVDNNTIMESGICIECGAKGIDGLSCYEMFQFPLVWEHNDPKLYDLHFWLVSCYMIQHPSNYTEDGYNLLIKLFTHAYDNKWGTDYILRKNRELVLKIGKITNPLPNHKRKRIYRKWSMTIEDIYINGEKNAINNISKWRDMIRKDLQI